MKVLVATPMYNSLCTMHYHQALLDFLNNAAQNQISVELLNIGNESLITRARNGCISHFYYNCQDADYLIFWDNDIALAGSSIVKMIKSGKDIIGAPIRLKNKFAVNFNILNIRGEEDGLIFADSLGTGLLLMSKKVINELCEHAVKNDEIYSAKSNTFPIPNAKYIFDIFQVGNKNKHLPPEERIYLSEDYYMCHTARELGYKIYIDSSIDAVHTGTMEFRNSDKLLFAEPETKKVG